LAKLQQNLDILNSDPGFKLLVNLKDTEFDAIVENAMLGIDMEKPITLTFSRGAGGKAMQELAENFAEDSMVEFLRSLRETER
jgi:hypothetical protein